MPQSLPNPPTQASTCCRIPDAIRRFEAPAPLRLWHLASLDAPTVAVVWSLAFAWAARVRLPVWIPLLLALAAWPVYVADRLLDARTALRTASPHSLRERHLFHHRHRRVLVLPAIAAAGAAVCIVFTLMPVAARERNSVLAVAALAYFAGVHSSRGLRAIGNSSLRAVFVDEPMEGDGFPPFPQKDAKRMGHGALPAGRPFMGRGSRSSWRVGLLLNKELLVGLLFTAACVLPALSRAAARRDPALWPLAATAVFFALLAWLNCHAIDRWESSEEHPAWRVFLPACLLAFAGVALGWLLASSQPRCAALVFAGTLSVIFLALLDRLRKGLTPLALRAAADLVLLTPLALLMR